MQGTRRRGPRRGAATLSAILQHPAELGKTASTMTFEFIEQLAHPRHALFGSSDLKHRLGIRDSKNLLQDRRVQPQKRPAALVEVRTLRHIVNHVGAARIPCATSQATI